MEKAHFVFVTGGVCSSLGKGITAAALGALFVARGRKVSMMKLDPYLNNDAGTMNPSQHGEVFVTDDGYEADLDLGHYERFTQQPTSSLSNVTTGQIYNQILSKERKGDFLGSTIQVIPHVTNEIKRRIKSLALETKAEIMIVEIGGTVGDIEGEPFLEAIRQLGREDSESQKAVYIHLTLLPYIKAAGELKTKPTQHSVKLLRQIGIQPDFLVCRCEHPIDDGHKKKLKTFCSIKDTARIIEARDLESVYEAPAMLKAQGLDTQVLEDLGLESETTDSMDILKDWNAFNTSRKKALEEGRKIKVALVGKYYIDDAYICVDEAVNFAAWHQGLNVELVHVDSTKVSEESLKEFDGIIIPGGFGARGIEGKIATAKYAREKEVPFLGLCLGLQVAIIEFARNVVGIHDANSTEFDEVCREPVVDIMADQKAVMNLGGSMRLGAFEAEIKIGTNAYRAYDKLIISERHRHRYEVNNAYVESFEQAGLVVSGRSFCGDLVEIVELPNHPWYVACQFHPEFKSNPLRPHPLFLGLMEAIKARTCC
jgi:CTP synthase